MYDDKNVAAHKTNLNTPAQSPAGEVAQYVAQVAWWGIVVYGVVKIVEVRNRGKR